MEIKKIPVYKPSLHGNEKKYILDCLNTTWISSKGRYITNFEESFSKYLGINHAVAVTNGTVALHLALLALGIGAGDEVLVPTLTYIASVNAITYTGATPVFVDSIKETWQIDPENALRKITPKTKAILVVHLFGHPCQMDKIMTIAKDNALFLIEDCAEAIGSKFNDKYVGQFGEISTFSFFGNKTITTGEGGMVVTNDLTLAERVRHLKGQGLAKHREYWHDIIGFNYRMTNICAAIGLAQLERIEEILLKKRKISDLYKDLLKDIDLIVHPEVGNVYHSYWMVSILVPNNLIRDELRIYLSNYGIETRPVFFPVHTMPIYSNHFSLNPISEEIGHRGITLPSYPDLVDEEINFITDKIRNYFEMNRKA